MRLLFVTKKLPPDAPSGRAAAFLRVANALSLRHDITIISGWEQDRALLPPGALGIDLRGRSDLWIRWQFARALGSAVRRVKPDVVVVGSAGLPRSSLPTVGVVRDLVYTGWESNPVDQFRRHRKLRSLDAVVVPSQVTRQAVVGLGVDPWRVEWIPDLVPSSPAQPCGESRILRLLHPGRIFAAKGQHLSIDAVSRLTADEKARVKLTVVGAVRDPRYFHQLRLAARHQPVDLHTDVPDLAPYYAAADLVLYPTSLAEGFPDCAVEAMAAGRPVVWSDTAGVREAVGGHGLAVQPDSVEALRAQIRAALADPQALTSIAEAGKRWVLSRHETSSVVRQWEQVLHRVARQG